MLHLMYFLSCAVQNFGFNAWEKKFTIYIGSFVFKFKIFIHRIVKYQVYFEYLTNLKMLKILYMHSGPCIKS